jgi:hypothetical protein
MKSSKSLFLLACCVSVFNLHLLDATSYNTTTGGDLNKAIVVTSELLMSGTDAIIGTVELRGGLRTLALNGPGTMATNLPIGKSITFRGGSSNIINLLGNIHLDGLGGSFLLDTSASSGIVAFDVNKINPTQTIYLDSDVTVSGNNPVELRNVNIDGQGHLIDFSNSLNGGLVIWGTCTFKNVTFKNVWFSPETGFGNFFIQGTSGDFGLTTITFDNVNIIARKFNPFMFYFSDTRQYMYIKNNVLLSNFGNFIIFNNFDSGGTAFGIFKIFSNSSLIVDNSTLALGTTSIVPSTDHRLFFNFESNTAQLELDNGTFVVDNNNFNNNYATDVTVTLSVGTIIVRGNSYLEANSLLLRNGKASLRIGDGVSAAGDMNIIIDPGATLNLVSTNTQCSVRLQNTH